MPELTDSTAVLLQVLPALEAGWHWAVAELPMGAVPMPVRDPSVVEAVIGELDGGHGLTLVLAGIMAWRRVKKAWAANEG